jgi:putative transposase
MSRRVSPSVKRSYGVQRVTRVWGTSRATLYRHRGQRDEPRSRRRPGPVGPMPDPALVEAIRALLAASPFHGEGHRKIWARLRFAGIRTSKRRVLRLMREHGLLAPGRVGRPHGPRAHDGTIRTERVDAMWGTDLTSTMTGEGQASIFVTVDHCSTECVGIHAARRATRFEALEPLRQGVRACFGAFGAGVAGGLELRHDHGSQFVADDYQRELAFLGIESSPAFVREPEGNGCVERFIRTLKEPAVGPPLRYHRGATLGAPRLPGHLQPDLDRRTPRLPDPSGRQSGAACAAPGSRMKLQCGVSQPWTATSSSLAPALMKKPKR